MGTGDGIKGLNKFGGAVQVLQLVTLIIGLVVVSMSLGAKGEQLEAHHEDMVEMRSIVKDLVKAQIANTVNGKNTDARLADLSKRIHELETKP